MVEKDKESVESKSKSMKKGGKHAGKKKGPSRLTVMMPLKPCQHMIPAS